MLPPLHAQLSDILRTALGHAQGVRESQWDARDKQRHAGSSQQKSRNELNGHGEDGVNGQAEHGAMEQDDHDDNREEHMEDEEDEEDAYPPLLVDLDSDTSDDIFTLTPDGDDENSDPAHLFTRSIKDAWRNAVGEMKEKETVNQSSLNGSLDVDPANKAVAQNRDLDEQVVRSLVDAVGREVVMRAAMQQSHTVVNPAENSEIAAKSRSNWKFQANLRDAMDAVMRMLEIIAHNPIDATKIASTSAQPASSVVEWFDPGAYLVSILEDLVDILTVEAWAEFFGWLESRGDRITAGMQPNKGKSLSFLKVLNALLRQTPKTSFLPSGIDSANIFLRARIHLFISQHFRIFDQSGLNLRGEYATELAEGAMFDDESTDTTLVEEETGRMHVNQDSTVDKREEEEGETIETDAVSDKANVRAALKSVLQVFANPPSIVPPPGLAVSAPTPLDKFKNDTDVVLKALKEATDSESARLKSKGASSIPISIDEQVKLEARFLIGEDIQQDMEQLSFRRQLYIQFLIFFNQLHQHSAKDKAKMPKDLQFPATFQVAQEDIDWADSKASGIRSALAQGSPAAKQFEAFVATVLNREQHYALWKHLSCFDFSRPSIPEEDISRAEEARQRLTAPLRPYVFKAGTRALSQLARDPLTSVDQLKDFKLNESIEGLKEKYDFEVMNEEDDKAMGKLDEKVLSPYLENKASLSWRAMRLAASEDLELLAKVPNGDLPTLVAEREKKRNPTAAPEGTTNENDGDTQEAEGEGEAETEEIGTPAEVGTPVPQSQLDGSESNAAAPQLANELAVKAEDSQSGDVAEDTKMYSNSEGSQQNGSMDEQAGKALIDENLNSDRPNTAEVSGVVAEQAADLRQPSTTGADELESPKAPAEAMEVDEAQPANDIESKVEATEEDTEMGGVISDAPAPVNSDEKVHAVDIKNEDERTGDRDEIVEEDVGDRAGVDAMQES